MSATRRSTCGGGPLLDAAAVQILQNKSPDVNYSQTNISKIYMFRRTYPFEMRVADVRLVTAQAVWFGLCYRQEEDGMTWDCRSGLQYDKFLFKSEREFRPGIIKTSWVTTCVQSHFLAVFAGKHEKHLDIQIQYFLLKELTESVTFAGFTRRPK